MWNRAMTHARIAPVVSAMRDGDKRPDALPDAVQRSVDEKMKELRTRLQQAAGEGQPIRIVCISALYYLAKGAKVDVGKGMDYRYQSGTDVMNKMVALRDDNEAKATEKDEDWE